MSAKDPYRAAGDQYLTGLTLYFIGYVLFEVSLISIYTSSARQH